MFENAEIKTAINISIVSSEKSKVTHVKLNIREPLHSSFALITNQIFSCKVTWQAPLSTSTGFEAKGSRTKAELLPFVHTNVSDWPLTHVSGASNTGGLFPWEPLFLQYCHQHFWVTHVLLFFALLPLWERNNEKQIKTRFDTNPSNWGAKSQGRRWLWSGEQDG